MYRSVPASGATNCRTPVPLTWAEDTALASGHPSQPPVLTTLLPVALTFAVNSHCTGSVTEVVGDVGAGDVGVGVGDVGVVGVGVGDVGVGAGADDVMPSS